ncbi:MAG: hypothetical protein WBA29_01540 [Xanthobacteraceae bacterium]
MARDAKPIKPPSLALFAAEGRGASGYPGAVRGDAVSRQRAASGIPSA